MAHGQGRAMLAPTKQLFDGQSSPLGEAFCEHRPFLWVAVLFFVCLYALFGFPRSAAKNSVRGWYSAKRPRHILYIYGGLARWLY